LAYATVLGQSAVSATEGSLEFIRIEGEVLSGVVGPWFGYFFWFAGIFALFSTNLGVLDLTSRAIADILKVDFLRESRFWSESKLYFMVIWTMIVLGSLILIIGVNEPVTLIVISAAGTGGVMVLYIALLVAINRRFLPEPIKLGGYRLVMMGLAFLFFLFFAGWFIISLMGQFL
jgi:hypothetical protein